MTESASAQEEVGLRILDLGAAEFAVGEGTDKERALVHVGPIGTWSRVPGPSGPACRFEFVAWSQGREAAFSTPIQAGPAWDEAAGISFLVKGDGSKDCAAIQFADATDEGILYEFWFSIESTEWRKVPVPWCDFMPVTPQARFLDPKHGYRPSRLGFLRFGKYVWRRDCPAYSYAVGDLRLEPEIRVDATDYTPPTGGTPRLLAKLQAKEPVSVVTLGDSLTDPRHWANVDTSWARLLATKMKDVFEVEVSVVHASMAGGRLTECLTQSALWLPLVPEPDLITIWCGAHEHWNKVTREHFRENLRLAVNHLRRLTRGRSEILLFTSLPWRDEPGAMTDFAQVLREVAAENRTGLVDVYTEFTKWADKPELVPWLYAWDGHLAAMGHAVVAKEVWEAITAPA